MEQIVVVIQADGNVTYEAQGYKGKACAEATRWLEVVLGSKVSDVKTADYYRQPDVAQRQR